MYIYMDIVVLLNLTVNALLLFLTAWLLGAPYRKIRLFGAVIFLTAYVVLFIVCPNPLYSHPAVKFAVSALAVWLAFGKRTRREFFALLGTFYLVSFFFGGAVLGYYFFSQTFASFEQSHFSAFHLPALFQGLFTGMALFFCLARLLFRRKAKACFITKLRLENNRRQVIVDGFWDSGNHLYDVTGVRPVILVEKNQLKPLFSSAANQFLDEVEEDEWFESWPLCEDEPWKKSMALISYRSIGNASFLLGQRLAKVELEEGGAWKSVDCIVGIYPRKLSADNAYQALLHSSMCFK